MSAAKDMMSFKMNYMCSSWAIFDHNLDGVVDNINPCGLMVLVTRGSKERKSVHPCSDMKLLISANSAIADMNRMGPLKSIYSFFGLDSHASIPKRSSKLTQDSVNFYGTMRQRRTLKCY